MSADNDGGADDGFGLDKAARLQAGRETEAEVEPLEPSFPWQAEPFDPGFFLGEAPHDEPVAVSPK